MQMEKVGDLLKEHSVLQVMLKDIDACIQKMEDVEYQGLLKGVEFLCGDDKNNQIFHLTEPGVGVQTFRKFFLKEMNSKRNLIEKRMWEIEVIFSHIGE